MTDALNWSDERIKEYLTDMKVLFVTNSTCHPGNTLVASLNTYLGYIPIHNFLILPGYDMHDKDSPFVYGARAFISMFEMMYKEVGNIHRFDYVIYIDDDCFITDFRALVSEFMRFAENDEYSIGGPQDGGVFCHRNHSHMFINTFLSFWNIKLIREKIPMWTFHNLFVKYTKEPLSFYKDGVFCAGLKCASRIEYAVSEVNANVRFRNRKFKGKLPPYCEVVKDDPTNPTEPHQIPYSYGKKESDDSFEPYYAIEKTVLDGTEKPIYYFRACDLYDPDADDEDTDNSGLTSSVYMKEEPNRLIAVHTWFSRLYNKYPLTQKAYENTVRINKLILKYSKI